MKDNFKNRRLFAWLSFACIILILIVSIFNITIANKELVSIILYCLTGIVMSYFGVASYEFGKQIKYTRDE